MQATRLNPTHLQPKFLIDFLSSSTRSERHEVSKLLRNAMKNHCYHEGGVTRALQRDCQQDIRNGNFNLFM
eukprot:SAG31_NODE_6317_length_2068_cov_1.582529_4_plen_71_part_00